MSPTVLAEKQRRGDTFVYIMTKHYMYVNSGALSVSSCPGMRRAEDVLNFIWFCSVLLTVLHNRLCERRSVRKLIIGLFFLERAFNQYALTWLHP